MLYEGMKELLTDVGDGAIRSNVDRSGLVIAVGTELLSTSEATETERKSSELKVGRGDEATYATISADRKSTRLNSSHSGESRMPSSA